MIGLGSGLRTKQWNERFGLGERAYKEERPSINRELLYSKYIGERKSISKIATELGISTTTVHKRLIKYGIPRRPPVASRERKMTLSREELRHLYLDKGMSASTIAKERGWTPETVRRWMAKWEIPRRDSYKFPIKYPRKPFSDNNLERAYLCGLRVGDIHARKRTKDTIEVTTSTTHPGMKKLFRTSFEKYGKITEYPFKGPFGHEWRLSAYLDKSFEFLVKIPETIPNGEDFYAFLAGYGCDSEGSWTFTRCGKKASSEFCFKSVDRDLLEKVKDTLEKEGYHPTINLVAKAGTKTSHRPNAPVESIKDCYRLNINRQKEVVSLANKLLPYTRHPEKIERITLVLEADKCGSEWTSIESKYRDLIRKIKEEVKECKKESEEEVLKREEKKRAG